MRVVDRYIASAIMGGVSIALLVLLSLFAFFGLVEEMGDVGRGSYGVWQAGQYVFLNLMPVAYQLFPIAALIGCIMGLGGLASNSELIAIRAAGISLNRLLWSVAKVGMLMLVLVLVLGEGIAPYAQEYAQKIRGEAITGDIARQGSQGMWARDDDQFIHIQDVVTTSQLANLTIYQFAENNRLAQVSRASQALYQEGAWQLQGVAVVSFSGTIPVSQFAVQPWQTTLNPEMIELVQLDPESQSMLGLYQYVTYLKENALAAGRYEMALWSKIATPIVTMVMMMLAVPFVMGSLRSVGIGQRIFIGTIIGLCFHLLNQMSNYAGLVFGFNAMLSSLLPTFVVSVVALLLIRRLR